MMAKQKNLPLPLAQNEPGPPTNLSFQLVFPASGVAQGPSFVVPPGCSVTCEPVGPAGLNAAACYLAQYYDQLNTSYARIIVPGTGDVVVPWPVANLVQIYAFGEVGQGLLIKVQGGGIQ